MKKYGLIGYPLSHSFSKKYFSEKFIKEAFDDSLVYENFELADLSELPDLINSHPNLIGLNVTIPYKEKVMSFLNEIDEVAMEIGAVNTIKITRDANGVFLKGYNTDCIGFDTSLTTLLQPHHTGALILGTGGASKAVAYVLRNKNIPCRFVSRNPGSEDLSYSSLNSELLKQYPVIINTTPLGTYPDLSRPPLPYNLLGPHNLLFDLVYNPPVTEFMNKGMEVGATVYNGYDMLVAQAEASWMIWNL